MKRHLISIGVISSFLLAGCANEPLAPNVAVMPPAGKPFEVFQADDQYCRAFASQQVGVEPGQAAQNQVVSGAVAGTVIGAAAGALIGGGHGEAAGAGAGMGLLMGSAVGADSASWGGMSLQRRYDIAYEQCMYAKGNVLPSASGTRYYGSRATPQTVIVLPPATYPSVPLPPPPPQ
jgi:outer membrane lipoprotein SlyB